MSTIETPPSESALKELREPSTFSGDEGELVGKDPRKLSGETLSLYFRAKNPLKALRERCLDCCCGQQSEVRKCTAVNCPSWPFRMGTNPFRQKRVMSADQKRALAERLGRT